MPKVQEGHTMRWQAPPPPAADVAKDTVIPLGQNRVGIAADNIPAGQIGDLWLTGVFNGIPCVEAEVYAQGDLLYWDANAGTITSVAGGNIPAGWAFQNKPAGAATCELKLNG